MQNIYIGRQPIIDSDSNLSAYEILYKGSDETLSRYSSSSIINNVLNKFGRQSLLGNRLGFVKIDDKFLLHDIIFSLPNSFFAFSLLGSVELTERVIERVEQLYEKDYILSIDNLALTDDCIKIYEPILDKLSFIKLNIKESSHENLKSLIDKLKSHKITVIADNVDNLAEYEEAKEFGCDWFQGYFFSEPKIIENAKYEPSQMAILKLYNLLMQDVSIDEITREFELNHEITVQLLQFINSGAFHFANKISSIHHILTLIGRIPLGQWLMLMIYSKSVSKDGQTPLMLMVRHRTELMENILKTIEPKAGSNRRGEAYFVGVLSLIDTVFGVKLEEILSKMNISDEVEAALLRNEGILGEIFTLIKDVEEFKIESNYKFEQKHKLPSGAIEKIVLESIKEVDRFEKPLSA